jgi:hypothetical protein
MHGLACTPGAAHRGRPPSLRVTGRGHGCHGLCEALGREGMLPGWPLGECACAKIGATCLLQHRR